MVKNAKTLMEKRFNCQYRVACFFRTDPSNKISGLKPGIVSGIVLRDQHAFCKKELQRTKASDRAFGIQINSVCRDCSAERTMKEQKKEERIL
jgi:hypothetical protein